MTKHEFLDELRARLSGLPEHDLDERIAFYREMIDDRIEEGLDEEEAVRDVGDIDCVVSQVLSDVPLATVVKEKIKPKRKLEAWEIVLIILGSPIWLPLLLSAIAVALSLYVVIWSVIISLWAVLVSFCAVAVTGIVLGVWVVSGGGTFGGLALLGVGLIFAGLSIFMAFGCIAASKGVVKLTGKCILAIKKCFVGKERA